MRRFARDLMLGLYGDIGQVVKRISLELCRLLPSDVSWILGDAFPPSVDARLDCLKAGASVLNGLDLLALVDLEV